MTSSPTDPPPPQRSFAPSPLAGLALGALALLSMAWILGNAFVQDDSGVIVGNELIRHWSGIWRAFGEAYWPPLQSGELYRPLTIAGFTAQWMLGGGAPLLFRVVSLALYLGSVLVVWRLLRTLTPKWGAWIGAAIFAVHPVHTEAVAVAVNQSELLVAILLMIAVLLRIEALRGHLAAGASTFGICALFLVAVFTKEHALVLPGLLFAVDLLVDRDGGGVRRRLERWRWQYLALFLLGAGFWAIRFRVLGPGTGTTAAEAIAGVGMAARAYTMLGVPAEWLRLLLWPAHLQVDWNLLEWVPTRGWTTRETAGALALMSFAIGLGATWRRRPVAALGLLWMAVALAPVSNILLPSGIVLAERTLFLPSIGLVLLLADLLGPFQERWLLTPRPHRLAVLTLTALVLGLGVVRSAVRMVDWRDRESFLFSQAENAPHSWRARIAFGLMLADHGDTTAAKIEIHRAIASRPDDPLVAKAMVDRMRLVKGECVGPVIAYRELLVSSPRRSDARGSLVACLLYLGRYAEAGLEATRGVATGLDADYFRYVEEVADSAAGAHAPPGTVRLRPVGLQATVVGDPRSVAP